MQREQIKAQALANGFKLKPQPDGSEDLNPYVYEFARALTTRVANKTPAAEWREAGQEDPHGDRYDCERAALAMGNMTDDQLANAVFTHDHRDLDIQAILAGEPSSIGLLTAAKDRIRWLSRSLTKSEQERDQLKAAVSLAIDTFRRYEMDVETYPTIDHIKMMRNLNGVLVKHDAEVIKNAGDYLHKMGLINSNAHLMLKHHANQMLCASNQAKEVQHEPGK